VRGFGRIVGFIAMKFQGIRPKIISVRACFAQSVAAGPVLSGLSDYTMAAWQTTIVRIPHPQVLGTTLPMSGDGVGRAGPCHAGRVFKECLLYLVLGFRNAPRMGVPAP
jgi:hypothetical protein